MTSDRTTAHQEPVRPATKPLLIATALDLIVGLAGSAIVLLANDSFGADLRIYLVAAVTLLSIGVWRGGSEGLPVWLRLLLTCAMPLYSAVSLGARHWPLDGRMLVYSALFPAVQWASTALGFRLRRSPVLDRRRWLTTVGAALIGSSIVAAATMVAFSRWLSTDAAVDPRHRSPSRPSMHGSCDPRTLPARSS
jgi:hypothetical protein